MPWYFFAILTPALYSITNFIEKFLIEKKIRQPLVMVFLSGLFTFFIGIFILIFNRPWYFSEKEVALLILAGLFLVFYLAPYFKALKMDDTSQIVPLFQFTPVFVLIFSSLFLKETLILKQIVGAFLVVLGGFYLSLEKKDAQIFKPRLSFWYMLLASLMYGVVGVLFRTVVKSQSYWPSLAFESLGVGLGVLLLFFIFKLYEPLKKDWVKFKLAAPLMSLNSIISLGAILSEAYAISLVPVTYVSLAAGTQPIFVLIYGIFLSKWFPKIIKENVSTPIIRIKLITIAFILLGLYLVYF